MAKTKRDKRKELDAAKQIVEMNMTPMIDMTFLILVFFMLVCHLSNMELEQISLPHADQAHQDEEQQQKAILIVNVRKDDVTRHKRVVHISGREYKPEQLKNYLQWKAEQAVNTFGPDPKSTKHVVVSPLQVVIRCDRHARYEGVTWIFEACSTSRPGVIHILIGATKQKYD